MVIQSIIDLSSKPGYSRVSARSSITGQVNTRDIPAWAIKIKQWMDDKTKNIQDVFPNLSDDDREFLITGITPEEWDKFIPELDEEDD